MMKATPFSKEPYYPMLLSNGQDGIVIGYCGTNVSPISGHAALYETLGVACGWYKASTRAYTKSPITQILRAVLHVEVFGAPCMASHYEQYLNPEEGVLITKLIFAKHIHVTVESFLTEDGLWGEKVTVDQCPDNADLKLGFGVLRHFCGYGWMKLQVESELFAKMDPAGVAFDYTLTDAKGRGALWASTAFDRNVYKEDYPGGPTATALGMYDHVEEGMSFSRVLTCVDETECAEYEAEFVRREALAEKGYEAVKTDYIEKYRAQTGGCSVTVPEEKLQGVYDLSRFHVNGHYNRQSGAINLGNMPHLWGGGLHCSYDANFAIHALLNSGDLQAAEKYKQFFVEQGKLGREMLQKINVAGTAFTGWTNCFGGFARNGRDMAQWLINEKPLFVCCEVLNRYDVWKYTDQQLDEESRTVLQDVWTFLRDQILRERDGKYVLIDVKAGTEAGFDVEADTALIIYMAATLRALDAMLGENFREQIARDILESMEINYTEEGVLMPFKDAPYLGGGQMDYYIYTLPDAIDIKSVDKALEVGKTPWGYTFEQTTEEKRHWPWIHSRAAICYTHEGMHAAAMEHLLQMTNYCSAVGALPEYIRMDGLAINYWYTSAHALFVWALHDALVHVHKDELRLCYGIIDQWQDFSCKGIYLENGLNVDMEIKGGVLQRLTLQNRIDKAVTVRVKINSCFEAELPEVCTVEAGSLKIYEKGQN